MVSRWREAANHLSKWLDSRARRNGRVFAALRRDRFLNKSPSELITFWFSTNDSNRRYKVVQIQGLKLFAWVKFRPFNECHSMNTPTLVDVALPIKLCNLEGRTIAVVIGFHEIGANLNRHLFLVRAIDESLS